jgi:hypothetical protein
LESITADNQSPAFHVINNCLIEKETKTIIATCKTSVIPEDDNVNIIGQYAFEGSQIKEIIIPENITDICEGAFYRSAIEEIYIPSSVRAVEDNAFSIAQSFIPLFLEQTHNGSEKIFFLIAPLSKT